MPCSDRPPGQGNVEKHIHKKRAMNGQIQGLLVLLSLSLKHLGEMISLMKYPLSHQLYFAYLAKFVNWVSCLTPKFGAPDQKMSL